MYLDYLLLLFSGFIGGLLAGLLGIGGGVIYILILPIFLQSAGVCDSEIIQYTIANSVFAIFMASLSGNVFNFLKKDFYISSILKIGVPSSIASVFCMHFIVKEGWYSKEIFNIIILLLLIFMLVKMSIKQKTDTTEKDSSYKILGSIGLLAGFASALSGLGGGVLIVPLLQSLNKTPIIKAKNISLGVIGIMAFTLSIYNLGTTPICISNQFQIGLIVFPTVMVMAIGVVLGSPAGAWVSYKLQPNYIKTIFILLLISVIIRKCFEIFI